jgi:EAL domain-containing protein (putative c-di-GMP-specific phosphodiesterase class I)
LHLQEPDFIQKITEITDEAGIDHSLLEIELTESVVCGNLTQMNDVLEQLHAAGFSVAMDDFGAGYSSLNVLKNLDFDCVKLDKEFLAKGEGNPRQRQVISGLVKMVKELGCCVVAEGVETQEQATFLRDIGCDMAQGFLFSCPLPADEFAKRLAEDAVS